MRVQFDAEHLAALEEARPTSQAAPVTRARRISTGP